MSNDFLTYYILPTEQLIIDQLKRYNQIVVEYEKINKQNEAVMKQIVDNQASIIAKHTEKLELYSEYINQMKNKNSIGKNKLFK